MTLSKDHCWPWTDEVDIIKYAHISKWPKISIITPSYNQGEFLEETILSVLKQNYPNLEYMVIDGGSNDHSIDIIKKYESKLTYWISEKDYGTYDANNKGLRLITGDYWCILNSDDCLLPDTLLLVASKIMNSPEEVWLCGGEIIIDGNSKEITKKFPVKPTSIKGYTFLNGCWISHPTVFLKKEVLQTVGYFRKTHMMDTDYWLNMEKAGFSPCIIREYLASYRIHKDAKSVSKIKIQTEFIRIYKNFTEENKLETDLSIKSKLVEHTVELYTYHVWEELVAKKRLSAFSWMLKILKADPSVIFKPWYLGLIKRLIVGLSKNDPIISLSGNFDNSANWNI